MHDVAVIEDPAAAGVSLDPMRSRLLAALAQPGSATTLAAQVGLSRQKVNYHLRALERHGLVELVEERKKGNMTERVLRATAASYVISPAALAAVAPDPHSDSAQSVRSRRRLRASAWPGEASERDRGDCATAASQFRWSKAKAEVRASGGSGEFLGKEAATALAGGKVAIAAVHKRMSPSRLRSHSLATPALRPGAELPARCFTRLEFGRGLGACADHCWRERGLSKGK